MAGRTLGPILVALAVSLSQLMRRHGGLTGVTTAMSSVEKTAMLGGAIAVVIGIVFGVFQFMGRNIAGGFMPSVAGCLQASSSASRPSGSAHSPDRPFPWSLRTL